MWRKHPPRRLRVSHPARQPRPAAPTTLAAVAPSLLDWLNAGASGDAIHRALGKWGLLGVNPGAAVTSGGITPAKVLAGDASQVVLVYFDPASVGKEQAARLGDVLVLTCTNGKYQQVYLASADAAFAGPVPNPRLLGVMDVTGDGVNDLAFVSGECGAAACLEGISVLTQANGAQGLTNITTDIANGPYPSFTFVPLSSDQSQALVIAYGTLPDVSAGPQRIYTDTWVLANGAYTLTATLKEPPSYRIHALHDADDAFRRKDFAAAQMLYGRVISDTALQAWDGPGALADELSVLSAFGRFRLAELSAAQGNVTGVDESLAVLKSSVVAGTPAEVYLNLATAFANQFKDTNDYTQACNSAVAFAERNPASTQQIGIDVFGFANYDYGPDDMCLR